MRKPTICLSCADWWNSPLCFVTMQVPRTFPLDLDCKDKFLIQIKIVFAVTIDKDVTASMMLWQILVTKQTGFQGKVVSKVYLCSALCCAKNSLWTPGRSTMLELKAKMPFF